MLRIFCIVFDVYFVGVLSELVRFYLDAGWIDKGDSQGELERQLGIVGINPLDISQLQQYACNLVGKFCLLFAIPY